MLKLSTSLIITARQQKHFTNYQEDQEKCPCKPAKHSYVEFSACFIISDLLEHIAHM